MGRRKNKYEYIDKKNFGSVTGADKKTKKQDFYTEVGIYRGTILSVKQPFSR